MDEVKKELSEFNVKYVLRDESMGYFEQASILQHTKVFISPHGAGMNNVFFLLIDATAIEIVYSDPAYRCPEEYYCLCSAIGVEYYMTASEGTSSSQLKVLFPWEIGNIIHQKIVKYS
jgi:capsular polysaccharide biosynthesis protein